MQEAFIKVVDYLSKYNEEGKFHLGFPCIAHNLAIDHFRKQNVIPSITVEDGSTKYQ
jgi:DNA-directed RNA polymerase specialized sigma24 family protein